MTARDKNNKIIKEADWVESNGRIYQVNYIWRNGYLQCWWSYIKSKSKVCVLNNVKELKSFNCIKVNDPIAYNITDND